MRGVIVGVAYENRASWRVRASTGVGWLAARRSITTVIGRTDAVGRGRGHATVDSRVIRTPESEWNKVHSDGGHDYDAAAAPTHRDLN